jgi:hypothetical protein
MVINSKWNILQISNIIFHIKTKEMKLTVTDCQRIKTVEQQNVDTGHMNKQSDLVIM